MYTQYCILQFYYITPGFKGYTFHGHVILMNSYLHFSEVDGREYICGIVGSDIKHFQLYLRVRGTGLERYRFFLSCKN